YLIGRWMMGVAAVALRQLITPPSSPYVAYPVTRPSMYVTTADRPDTDCWKTMSPVSITPSLDSASLCDMDELSTTTRGGQTPAYTYRPPRNTATMTPAMIASLASSLAECSG